MIIGARLISSKSIDDKLIFDCSFTTFGVYPFFGKMLLFCQKNLVLTLAITVSKVGLPPYICEKNGGRKNEENRLRVRYLVSI